MHADARASVTPRGVGVQALSVDQQRLRLELRNRFARCLLPHTTDSSLAWHAHGSFRGVRERCRTGSCKPPRVFTRDAGTVPSGIPCRQGYHVAGGRCRRGCCTRCHSRPTRLTQMGPPIALRMRRSRPRRLLKCALTPHPFAPCPVSRPSPAPLSPLFRRSPGSHRSYAIFSRLRFMLHAGRHETCCTV